MAKQNAIPETAVEQVKHGPAYVIIWVVAVLVFAGTTYVASSKRLMGWEYTWTLAINQWPDRLRTYFMIAAIAPQSILFGAVSVVAAFAVRMYHLAWRLSFTILAGVGLATAVQHVVGRLRPGDVVHGLTVRASESGFGYPSMHAMMIAVVMLTLFPYLPRGWRWVALILPVLSVALSQVYLGVQTPLDVVGGAALGVILAGGMRALPQRWLAWARLDSKR